MANWGSTNTSFATISNTIGSQGVATGVASGMMMISSTYQGVNGNTQLTVTKTLQSILVSPVNALLGVEAKLQYTAAGVTTATTALKT